MVFLPFFGVEKSSEWDKFIATYSCFACWDTNFECNICSADLNENVCLLIKSFRQNRPKEDKIKCYSGNKQ